MAEDLIRRGRMSNNGITPAGDNSLPRDVIRPEAPVSDGPTKQPPNRPEATTGFNPADFNITDDQVRQTVANMFNPGSPAPINRQEASQAIFNARGDAPFVDSNLNLDFSDDQLDTIRDSLRDAGFQGGTVVPPPEQPAGTTTEGAQVTQEERDEVREQVKGIFEDPNKFLTDKGVLQNFTDVDIYKRDDKGNILKDINGNAILDPSQFLDEDAHQVGEGKELEVVKAKMPEPVKVASFSAALIDPNSLTKAVDEIAKLAPMQAASMSEKLDGLLEGMEEGNVPLWARPAVTKVEQLLASRGISASSVGRDSLFNAIIQSALPIAQQDAAFEQEANKAAYQAKVQGIMTDVSMEFAAKQFNAQSQNQVNQFRAQLQVQVDTQNAERERAISMFNAQQENTMVQFEENLGFQRESFNAQMSSALEQSNVAWRRQVNKENTAGLNAVNQANVQNAFNLTNQSLTFMWQEMRDEAHWAFQASESDKAHRNQLEASILANESAMAGEIGKTLEGVLNGTSSFGKFLRNLWD